MKLKESMTIDEDIGNWLRHQRTEDQSVSSIVNEILREKMNETGDLYSQLHRNERNIGNLEKEREDILKKIEEIIKEGNKKEREEAEKVLKEEQDKNKRRLIRLKFCYERLKELNLLERFFTINLDEDLLNFSKEIYTINVNQGRSFKDSVGYLELKKLKESGIDFEKLIIEVEE